LRKLARGGGLPTTHEKEEEDIRSAYNSKDEAYLMVVKKSNNKAIGFIRVNGIPNKNVWLRMIIGDKNAWGKNYASDAIRCVLKWLFYELNIHRVELETYTTNKRAIRFFEKMGFKKEGVLREAHFCDGKYYDIISYGLLKDEFQKFYESFK
jgi:RimJ/RimL family protein N-acetyltransferase